MTECKIVSVAFGGEGIARKDGLVIFTPFTLPEERVELDIWQKKSNFARAHLQKILQASPHRIPAPCPYFMACGGCQLQHSSYPYQLELKKKFVEDALLRIGKISFPISPVVASEDAFAYRRHITLQLGYHQKWQLGFTSIKGSLLPIQSCLLFHASSDPILADLQQVVAALELPSYIKARAKLLKTEEGFVVAFTFSHTLSKQNLALLNSCKNIASVVGLILQMPGETITEGNFSLAFTCNGLHFTYSPFSFLQNHEEQSSRIYSKITQLLQNSHRILDLYCGIGVSTLLLAKEGKEVIGIEINPEAVALAKENGKLNQLPHVSFFCKAADASIKTEIEHLAPDAILVNPPKTGLELSVKQAFDAPCIRQIVYVSCHPPTLARDLSYLLTLGFTIQSIESFDMFPQTTHVETVVHLSK